MNDVFFTVKTDEVIKFDRTDAELELFWLFCGCVAGKTAHVQARLLSGFLSSFPFYHESPFEMIIEAERLGILEDHVRTSRLGQYGKLYRFMVESLSLCGRLRDCELEDLEAIHGCGPKTARYFLLDTRPDQRYAALDTHVLKELRANGIDAPRSTPSAGPKYRALEEEFLKLADASGMTAAEYDLSVWKKWAGYA
jgi:hypothetical protein